MIWMEKVIGKHDKYMDDFRNFNDVKDQVKEKYDIY